MRTFYSLPRTSSLAFASIGVLWCAQVGLDAARAHRTLLGLPACCSAFECSKISSAHSPSGINNSDVVEKKIADARVRLASVDGGCVDTVRKISRITIKSPKKGSRVPWATEHVANAFVAEVQKTVLQCGFI